MFNALTFHPWLFLAIFQNLMNLSFQSVLTVIIMLCTLYTIAAYCYIQCTHKYWASLEAIPLTRRSHLLLFLSLSRTQQSVLYKIIWFSSKNRTKQSTYIPIHTPYHWMRLCSVHGLSGLVVTFVCWILNTKTISCYVLFIIYCLHLKFLQRKCSETYIMHIAQIYIDRYQKCVRIAIHAATTWWKCINENKIQ